MRAFLQGIMLYPVEALRNIAIIAHVDHGKTTLIDKLLAQSGALQRGEDEGERLMDFNDLEKERGITILAKNTSLVWKDLKINIIDTPGHADFGGEVERILSMVDSVLLLVDAVEGPMPQTRFVSKKAFENDLNPIVMVNKIDRPGARPHWVVDQVFELFCQLGAEDEQLDFPIVYGSALLGKAGLDPDDLGGDLSCLLEVISHYVKPPDVNPDGPLQMQISALDYSSYVGVVGLGKIMRGRIAAGEQVAVINRAGQERKGKVLQVLGYRGLERAPIPGASAGDIVCVTGLEGLKISDTICLAEHTEKLPALKVDEPTMSMTFQVNTSPFAGREGKFVTSRHLQERLEREILHNVAMRIESTDHADRFKVSGRGELHLAVLVETMRREGYELAVGRPEVILRKTRDRLEEPYETLVMDVESGHQGAIMEIMGARKASIMDMVPDSSGRVRLEYLLPTKALLGFRTEFLTITSGNGLMNSLFSHYGPVTSDNVSSRTNGVLVSMASGKSVGFALNNLQSRGRLFVGPNEDIYEGMIVGLHARGNDLAVNPLKEKQLTNIRAAGHDENVMLTTPLRHSLESAIEFINDDELVEVTPLSIRIRKKLLTENERKRASRNLAL